MMMATLSNQGMMMGPMKGHLAPNSSPFKPTINKLSSQYLIQDQMSSHYHKLGTVKAAIDNRPPKSMTTSVKKRDQMRREVMAKQMKLLDFEKGMKQGSPHRQHPDQHNSMQRAYSVTVSKNGYDEVRPQSTSSFRSSLQGTYSRPSSSRRSGSSDRSPRSKSAGVLSKTYDGDYLDKHEERFKNTDTPFTPRLKKRNGKSFLAQSKHYAPPLHFGKEGRGKNMKSNKAMSSISGYDGEQKPAFNREEDHRRWVEDQSELVQRLSLDNTQPSSNSSYSKRQDFNKTVRKYPSDSFFGTSSLGRSFVSSRSDAMSYETKYRIEAEEDEMRYLEFINKVTNDILTRGIYSDRVLTQVMDRHLQENRGKLDEGRMRVMLRKLQEDLGVTSSVPPSTRTTRSTFEGTRVKTRGSDSDEHLSSRASSMADLTTRKKSPRQAASRKRREMAEAGQTSGSETSTSGTSRPQKKGILKKPTENRSSGSEQDVRSNLSSGEDKSENERHKLAETNVHGVDMGLKLHETSPNETESKPDLVDSTNSLSRLEPLQARSQDSVAGSTQDTYTYNTNPNDVTTAELELVCNKKDPETQPTPKRRQNPNKSQSTNFETDSDPVRDCKSSVNPVVVEKYVDPAATIHTETEDDSDGDF